MIKNNTKSLKAKALEMICKNRTVRTFIARKSPLWFFTIYFADHMDFDTAPFQYQMLDLIERKDWNLLCLVSFRGSSKTTIMNTMNVLWSVLGEPASKFVLIISATQGQAKQQMMNIRGVLENNKVLADDLGPFKEESDQWDGSTIVFTKLKARISVASVNEKIRGIKHLQHRPNKVIIDDPEDIQSAKTKEGRDKIYQWFKGEVLPIGAPHAQFIVLGNVVHERCLVMRLKQEITEGNDPRKIYCEYPVINGLGESAWPGKFPTLKDIEEERKRIGDDRTWYREFLLKIIPDDDQIIKRENIHYYDFLPPKTTAYGYRFSVNAVDPASKVGEANDYTAIVSAHIYGYGKNMKIYILPYPINRKMLFTVLIQTIKDVCLRVGDGSRTRTYIEGNAAQTYAVDQMRHDGYPVTEVISRGEKRERLYCIGPSIDDGQVVFAKKGCESIIDQAVNFGLEDHDDLCDALVILVREVLKDQGSYHPFSYEEPIPDNNEPGEEDDKSPTRFPNFGSGDDIGFGNIRKMIF